MCSFPHMSVSLPQTSMFPQIRVVGKDFADLKERLRQHPESQGLQRVLSATLACYIKQASEAGRLWGHICRFATLHRISLPSTHNSASLLTLVMLAYKRCLNRLFSTCYNCLCASAHCILLHYSMCMWTYQSKASVHMQAATTAYHAAV